MMENAKPRFPIPTPRRRLDVRNKNHDQSFRMIESMGVVGLA